MLLGSDAFELRGRERGALVGVVRHVLVRLFDFDIGVRNILAAARQSHDLFGPRGVSGSEA